MKEGDKCWAVDKYGLPQKATFLNSYMSDLGVEFSNLKFDDGTETDRMTIGIRKTRNKLCELMVRESIRKASEPFLTEGQRFSYMCELKKWQKLLEEE